MEAKMQINRLFEIVYILLHKRKTSATELATELGVSRRTICRDIDILSTAGVPIFTEKGKGGGISLLPNFVLNKSILSEQEQNEILSALHGLSTVKQDDQVLRKISAIFNKTATNWIEVDFSDWSGENDFFNDLKMAITERRIATMDYYNSAGEKTFRTIEPMQLWFKSKSWYLKGFCLTKQDMRVYKLTRIKNLTITAEHFTLRDLPAEQDTWVENGEEQKYVTLKLRIESEMAYRVYDDFYESSVEKQPDGSFIVSLTIEDDSWVRSFLLSYGRFIEVIEPESVRNILKEEMQIILNKYL